MIRRLRIVFRLPGRDLALLAETVICLGLARLALLLLPFRRVAAVLGAPVEEARVPPPSPGGARDRTVRRVGKAVARASRHLPWECTCLTQSIAAHGMLRRRGYTPVLFLGVARRDGALDFHAWLRQADYVVTGGGDLDRYTVVSAFV